MSWPCLVRVPEHAGQWQAVSSSAALALTVCSVATSFAGFVDLIPDGAYVVPLPFIATQVVDQGSSGTPAVLDMGILLSSRPNTSAEYNMARYLILTSDTAWPSEQQLRAWAPSNLTGNVGGQLLEPTVV
jgi:hypothetical protein